MDTFTTVLSVFSTVCAIVFGYIAFVRNRDKDKESKVKEQSKNTAAAMNRMMDDFFIG